MEIPAVSHVIVNAVMVCSCPARIVLVLNVIGGQVECPSCRNTWYSTGMQFSVIDDKVTIKVDIEGASNLILPGRMS